MAGEIKGKQEAQRVSKPMASSEQQAIQWANNNARALNQGSFASKEEALRYARIWGFWKK